MNVPLHVALRGIERAFDSWESKPRKRTVKSLMYCQEEVQAQYAEWLETRSGTNSAPPSASEDDTDPAKPFGTASVLEHLERGRGQLLQTAAELESSSPQSLAEALLRAADFVRDLATEFSANQNTEKLEISLTGLERMLSESIITAIPSEQLGAFEAEIKEQLRPYRSRMEKIIYHQTLQNLLMKKLREHFGVPRLSLFYL